MDPPLVRLRPTDRPTCRPMGSPMVSVMNYGTTHNSSHEMTHGAAYYLWEDPLVVAWAIPGVIPQDICVPQVFP